MTPSKTLLDLQDVDELRDRLVSRLRQVLAELRGTSAVEAARAEVGERADDLAKTEHKLRAVNLERQGHREHIAREEQKLYGGSVKSPKELQNLQAEVDALKRQLAGLDDVSLELMLERDELAELQKNAEQNVIRLQEQAEDSNRSLTREKQELAANIRDLDGRRVALTGELQPAMLALYERVRKAKSGKAVAPLKGDSCGECGMQLPRQIAQRVQGGENRIQCPSCHRILVH